MDYEKLKEVIAKQIKENGRREITGPVLQAVLMAMVDSLGEVYPQTYTDEEKAQARANIDALSNHNGAITKEKLSLEVQAILNDVANKQNITDESLATIAKTIVGAINELFNGGVKDKSIATSKIEDGAITDAKIASGAVTTPKIANGAVTTEKVNDGAITEPKLDTALVNIINSAVQPAELASAIATALASYVAKTDIVDTTGSATDKVMSQHGVTEAINGVTNKVTELERNMNYYDGNDISSIPSDINSANNTDTIWYICTEKGLPKIEKLKFLAKTGDVTFYKVKVIKRIPNDTAQLYAPLILSYEVIANITNSSAEDKTIKVVDLNVEWGDDCYLGINGSFYYGLKDGMNSGRFPISTMEAVPAKNFTIFTEISCSVKEGTNANKIAISLSKDDEQKRFGSELINEDFNYGFWDDAKNVSGEFSKLKTCDKPLPLKDVVLNIVSESADNYTYTPSFYASDGVYLGSYPQNEQIIGGKAIIKLSDISKRFDGATFARLNIGIFDGTSYTKVPSSTKISVSNNEFILGEIDSIKKSIPQVNRESILTRNQFFKGFWFRDDLNIGGTWSLLRTHQDMIELQDMIIEVSGDNIDNISYGLSLYDQDGNPLGNYPQNLPMYEGKIGVRKREIACRQYATAKYCRVNIGRLIDGIYSDADVEIEVYKYEYKPTIVVDKFGLGDFKTITGAVNYALDIEGKPVTIYIHNGVYDEHIIVGSDRLLFFKGETRDGVVMQGHTGQYVDACLWLDGDFLIENMTFKMFDDQAPSDWIPGGSQTDRKTMLPAYALHIDGGNGSLPPLNGEYYLSKIVNCTFYSVCNASVGCGLHANNKLVFENCEFHHNTKPVYEAIINYGALLVHDALGTHESEENQSLEVINCRCYSNTATSAKFDMTHSSDQKNVTMIYINNSFYAERTDAPSVLVPETAAKLHKISHGNNANELNA